MNEPNNGLPGKFSDRPGQINRLVKLEPIPKKESDTSTSTDPKEKGDASRDAHSGTV